MLAAGSLGVGSISLALGRRRITVLAAATVTAQAAYVLGGLLAAACASREHQGARCTSFRTSRVARLRDPRSRLLLDGASAHAVLRTTRDS